MKYFEEIDAWLNVILLGGDEGETDEQWFERVKKQVKEKLLESYRNGQKAGPRPPRKAETGERGAPEEETVERPKRPGYPKRGTSDYYRKPKRQ